MTQEYSLAFNEGEPIDATKLQKLVTFLNEVNAAALKMPSGTDIAQDVVSAVMTMGVSPNNEIKFSADAVPVSVKFDPPLNNKPRSVIVTLECPSDDMDLLCYLKNYDKNGCTVMINRVSGAESAGKAGVAKDRVYNVKIHYFATAQKTIA